MSLSGRVNKRDKRGRGKRKVGLPELKVFKSIELMAKMLASNKMYRKSMLLFNNKLDIDWNLDVKGNIDKYREYLKSYYGSNIAKYAKVIDVDDYKDAFVDIDDADIGKEYGRYALKYCEIEAGEFFVYDTEDIDENSIIYPKIGIQCKDRTYLGLADVKTKELWMSLTPNEINTMRWNINRSRGKVLTFGLGLGYYAYKAAMKEDVEGVYVVEYDKDIIRMFTECILPKMECKDKIHIIECDAYEYASKVRDGEYDYIFVDIWKSFEDIEAYIGMYKLLSGRGIKNVDYWIEKTFIRSIYSIVSYGINIPDKYYNEYKEHILRIIIDDDKG